MTFTEAVRQRMSAGEGNYLICELQTLEQAMQRAKPGDTVSLHPIEVGPPTIYIVRPCGCLEEFWPELEASRIEPMRPPCLVLHPPGAKPPTVRLIIDGELVDQLEQRKAH